MTRSEARFDFTNDLSGQNILVLEGEWTAFTINSVDNRLREFASDKQGQQVVLDVSQLESVDTAGAFIIDRTLREIGMPVGLDTLITGSHLALRSLLDVVDRAYAPTPAPRVHKDSLSDALERIGHGTVDAFKEGWGILSFIGEAFSTVMYLLLHPKRIRWTSVFSVMESAGLNALPIASMLSFFIGLVIAFLGVSLLRSFGAQIFAVDMVGILMLREFGIVLTAILLAGRTDSSFTAQIGAMKMREEVDAMRVLGLNPMEVLVAPRLLALIVMTPLLAFAATIAGILGGMLVLWANIDISPAMFIQRIENTVAAEHFFVGIVKAPVFAIVVALVGCRQGLLVEGDVVSLGERTTSSVVQAIFLVIVLDALFAIMFMELGV